MTLTKEEFDALVAARDGAFAERESLRGEVRIRQDRTRSAPRETQSLLTQAVRRQIEVRGTEQKDLFFNEAEALAPDGSRLPRSRRGIDVPAHTRKKRGRKPLDPSCHARSSAMSCRNRNGFVPTTAGLVEIGVEISEQLDIIPQQVRVIQHQRVKYACPCCDQGIKVTPAPARIIPKGLLTEAALAWVVTSKYMDALPLYRQAALLGRFGGDLSRNTLAASIVKVGEAVQPIINLLRDHLLDADLVHGDETTIQVLKESGKKAQTKSYLWAQPPAAGPHPACSAMPRDVVPTHAETCMPASKARC
jgi:transposase